MFRSEVACEIVAQKREWHSKCVSQNCRVCHSKELLGLSRVVKESGSLLRMMQESGSRVSLF